MPVDQRYWFHAKRYGWGWGLPASWQGWLVTLVYVALLAFGIVIFPTERRLAAFLAYVVILSVALVAVAWHKGEPPRWRWGGK